MKPRGRGNQMGIQPTDLGTLAKTNIWEKWKQTLAELMRFTGKMKELISARTGHYVTEEKASVVKQVWIDKKCSLRRLWLPVKAPRWSWWCTWRRDADSSEHWRKQKALQQPGWDGTRPSFSYLTRCSWTEAEDKGKAGVNDVIRDTLEILNIVSQTGSVESRHFKNENSVIYSYLCHSKHKMSSSVEHKRCVLLLWIDGKS